jgi:post-segregation antitoxin (ccd killing protein)
LAELQRRVGKGREVKVPVVVYVDSELLIRMLRANLDRSSIAKAAWRRELREKEKRLRTKQELEAVRAKDPRVTLADLQSRSVRIRRLRDL